MYDTPPITETDELERSIGRAAEALLARQRADGHWVFELEADATIPAEFVLLKHFLGEPEDLELERRIGVYLRRIQGGHGGWPLYHGGAFDIRTGKATELPCRQALKVYAVVVQGDELFADLG